MNNLKKVRIEKDLTQKEVAKKLGVSLRSYISYENEADKVDTIKYKYLLHELEKINVIDEDKGILSLKQIIDKCRQVFEEYNVQYCYLFGSYAKDKAKESSDVDLLVSTKEKGLKFFGLTEQLRETLHKRVDVLDLKQVVNNEKLLHEILKDGIKIYG